jgi:hypothetical protein
MERLLHTGHVDTSSSIGKNIEYLVSNSFLRRSFDYNYSKYLGIRYRDREAKHIILQRVLGCMLILILEFALDGTKELFIIMPELNLDVIVNTSVFILPWVATCSKWGCLQLEDKTNLVEDGKQELIDRIKEIINCDFTIMEHFAEFDQQ